jgi:hypothetical protein
VYYIAKSLSSPQWSTGPTRVGPGRVRVEQEGLTGLAAARQRDHAGDFCAI